MYFYVISIDNESQEPEFGEARPTENPPTSTSCGNCSRNCSRKKTPI